jgi:hypothetical protein
MLVMHVMTVHVCTYLIMLKQLSAGAGVFGRIKSTSFRILMALKVIRDFYWRGNYI